MMMLTGNFTLKLKDQARIFTIYLGIAPNKAPKKISKLINCIKSTVTSNTFKYNIYLSRLISYQGCNPTHGHDCVKVYINNSITCSTKKSIELKKKKSSVPKDGE